MVANRYSMQSMERVRQLIDERCGGSQQVFADRVETTQRYIHPSTGATIATIEKLRKPAG